MTNEQTLTPKNWTTFQHYRDRRPSWIKLHKTLLDDPVFNRLPIASQALAPKLWLLASEFEDGAITLTNDEMAFRLRTSQGELDKAVSPLIDAGYFTSSNGKPEPRQIEPKKEIERPSPSEVAGYCKSIGLPESDGIAMHLHWEEKGWGKVKNWKLTIQKWKAFGYLPSQKQQKHGKPQVQSIDQYRAEKLKRIEDARKELHGSASV